VVGFGGAAYNRSPSLPRLLAESSQADEESAGSAGNANSEVAIAVIFNETGIEGAFVIELEQHADERGSFARSFCRDEFEAHGLDPSVAQCNISVNAQRGTLRGMHSQAPGYEEAKLVRCSRGAIYDVIVDLRPGSPSHLAHVGVTLRAGEAKMFFMPGGVYHGFLTLEDDCEILYQMSAPYAPGQAHGYRWNDPAFGIEWPGEVQVISDRDASYADYDASSHPGAR
jgi:dTDP-4-dehydrorhamnose 3,5-epimerase